MDIALIVMIVVGLLLIAFASVAVVSTITEANKVELPDEVENNFQNRLASLNKTPVT